MMSKLRPLAVVAAVLLGLYGLLAAPMAVRAEEVVETTEFVEAIGTETNWCHLTDDGKCQGWCIIGKCGPKTEKRTQTWYVNGVPKTKEYEVFLGCKCL